MAKSSPAQFVRQVRHEISKVTWPSRKETTVATIMVLMLAVFAMVYFFVVDQSLAYMIKKILGLGA